MVRIALGGLMHESNTFAAGQTGVAAFEAGGLETGPGIYARWGEAHHEVGGFFEGATKFGFEAVPTLMGVATPAGPLTADAYQELTERLLAAIDGAGLVDAVLLALHGAMVAEGQSDADGALIERVRDRIGPNRPLVVSLDYHANVSPRMVAASDALVAYRTYPHVDQRLCGLRAAALAAHAAGGRIRPTQALSKPPLLINILAQETGLEPLRGLMNELSALDREWSHLDASILAGFPYADVAAAGPACVVVTDNAPALASETAARLSARIWNARHALVATPPGPAEAVTRALAAKPGSGETPVVLVDLGDNIGGGSAADSTVLIHELIRQGATGAIVVLHDPAAVQKCAAAGIGGMVTLDAGGKDDRNAPPLHVQGRVNGLHDGRYVEELPRHGGSRHNDQGLTAVVETSEHNTVVLNSRRHPPFSLGQLTSLGLAPQTARVLVVKAAVAYKAAYGPIAGTIIPVDTPGLTAVNPARYTYHKIRRPILPLDPESLVEETLR
jgi:microcystin degradation protein MlrC